MLDSTGRPDVVGPALKLADEHSLRVAVRAAQWCGPEAIAAALLHHYPEATATDTCGDKVGSLVKAIREGTDPVETKVHGSLMTPRWAARYIRIWCAADRVWDEPSIHTAQQGRETLKALQGTDTHAELTLRALIEGVLGEE